MELVKAIAMLCSLHNADTTDWSYKKQKQCQYELTACVILSPDFHRLTPEKHELILLKCVAERK